MMTGSLLAQRYRLVQRIAVGGMGEVWEASDTRLDRTVAVKVLREELSDDPEFLHRFRAEARTTASLDHPGIAMVHDYGETVEAGAYLVMELVRGEPLAAVIARGRVGAAQTLDVLEQAGAALQAAHARGLVHRDVKPGNILLTRTGQVKLTDFGIAKAVDAAPLTRSGMVMGTAHYIAPEQAAGQEAGPAADVYSLGVVGYECLAGRRPFHSDNVLTVAMAHIRDAPPPLPPDVPPPVRALIGTALAKDPRRRYGSGGEFAAATAAVRAGQPLPAPSGLVRASTTGTAGAAGQPPTVPAGLLLTGPRTRDAQPSGTRALPSGPVTAMAARRRRGAGRVSAWVLGLLLAAAVTLGGYAAYTLLAASPNAGPPQAQPDASAPDASRAPMAASAPVPVPASTITATAASSASETAAATPTSPATVGESLVDFVGRTADTAVRRLTEDGLVPRVRTLGGRTPEDLGSCYVLGVAPTGQLRTGQTVTVTCQEVG